MKDWLLKQIKAKEEARSGLKEKAKKSQNIDEVRSIGEQIEGLDGEIADFRAQLEAIPAEPAAAPAAPAVTPPVIEQRMTPAGQMNPLATFGLGAGAPAQQRSEEPEDRYATLEYRRAFMEFARTGTITPELRANAMTGTGDISAVIPSTILNEVIRKVTSYGQLFSRVRKLNVKGGMTIPILSLKPVATWIGESAVSDKQKVQANTSISFSYYGLECKVSVSLLADTVHLAGFENTITDLITEAVVKALDTSILNGTGTGTPLGITKDTRVPAAQIVTLSSTDFAKWDAWKKKVFAKMPLSYKAGASFFMASGTFEGYIDGMVDTQGQPVGRTNYGIADGPQERFGGKAVVQVEDDIIVPYDTAAVADVVAVYVDLKNYGFNSNMQMTMYRYFDHDTNEWVDKAILIADGKLIDPNGVVIVKKGA
ncbi:phage major capsid protein, HK97 family [Bacillus sp. OV166]|uniref:phage major capsid protein n=1 Tax=Bacillus sp. OV166 TaxID=1882763 RepID=UPI000A2AA739|nr:phage major capsid protein [Bacillus sp. OV166]SMQ75955.1 phage major capsid protein, HK97 family [Bacillus sp. OV166]